MKKCMKTALAAVLLAAMTLTMTACGNSQEKTYEKATKLLNDGKYAEAAEKFESLGSYEDASQMTMYAKAINEAENGNFEVAFKAFAALGDYKDCAQLQAYYVAREYEYNEMYAEAIEAYKVNPLFRDSQSRIERCQETLYKTAINEAENGNFRYAFDAFTALGDYKDSAQMYAYYVAREYEYNEEYEKAITAYGKDLTFKDSQERAEQCQETLYETGISEAENGNFEYALDAFEALGDYKDCVQLRAYYVAREYEYKGMYREAFAAYDKDPTFKDSQERTEQCREKLYKAAINKAEIGSFEYAYKAFNALGDYKDCIQLKAYYVAREYEYNKEYEKAIEAYGKDLTFKDSQERAEQCREKLWIASFGGAKAAYIDLNGLVVFPFQYEGKIGSFHEGFLTVSKRDYSSRELKYIFGYIDTTGKEVVPCQYDQTWGFSEGLAFVKKGGKYGYIDTTGTEVVPCQYDSAYDFSEGLARVEKDGEYGYIDTTGKEVIPCQYYEAERFSEGFACVEKYAKWGYIDTTGTEVVPCQYDYAYGFSEGFAGVEKYAKWGYIDTTGTEVVPCQYDGARSFSEGLAAVKKDGKYGYIDTTGTEVIPCQYDDVGSFSEGLACVKKDEKFGYVDTTGKVVVSCQYDDVSDFSDGLACVEKDGKYGYIDTTGKKVIPCQYEDSDDLMWEQLFSEGLAAVEKDGKWGYIDTTGKVVIPFLFSKAQPFSEGLAYVEIGE